MPLIEDLLLTKASLLMTQKAPTAEWLFEIEAIAVLSGERWGRNHFLLGYAVARLVTARRTILGRHRKAPCRSQPGRAGKLEDFLSADSVTRAGLCRRVLKTTAESGRRLRRPDGTRSALHRIELRSIWITSSRARCEIALAGTYGTMQKRSESCLCVGTLDQVLGTQREFGHKKAPDHREDSQGRYCWGTWTRTKNN